VTYEEFVLRNTRISAALARIADRTAAMAWVNSADSQNPEFVALMRAQDALIEAAEKLLSTYEESSR
jgi:hypothetical protein